MTQADDAYAPAWRRPIAGVFRKMAGHSTQFCVRLGIHPNTVSLSSILAAAGAGACFLFSQSQPVLLIFGVALCYLRLWLNMLDGMVALASGKASRWGEILNDLPDRVSDVLIFVGVAHSGLCEPFLAYWVAIAALLVAYVGTFGQAVGVQREFSGVMAKPWRMVALNVGAFLVLAEIWWGDGDLGSGDLGGGGLGSGGLGSGDLGSGGLGGGPFTWLDWAHVAILAGCVQTVWIRLARILRSLRTGAPAS